MSPLARRVPLANLLIRGSGAILAVLLVNRLPLLDWLGAHDPGQTLINVHILFNLMLLVTLPFCRFFAGPVAGFLPEAPTAPQVENPLQRSVLDDAVLDRPAQALASLRREVMRMAQVVEGMMTPTMELYKNFDKTRMEAIRQQDEIVNTALDDIRRYVAAIPNDRMRKAERKEARELTEYAIAIESAGDIVVKGLLTLACEKDEQGVKFSTAGYAELVSIHERIIANMALAANVLLSSDLEFARLLLEEKTEMTRAERASRKKHLKRLSEGSEISFDSSDIHLETLRSLKDFNSLIAAVAYPILYRGGQLLETRIIENMEHEDAED